MGEGEVKGTHAVIDGRKVKTREQFHAAVKRQLSLPEHYGMNLDALWDSLTGDVPRPLSIEWTHSDVSREHLGEYFDQIRKLLEELKQQDPEFKLEIR
jgi:ribonuclease inhibitor